MKQKILGFLMAVVVASMGAVTVMSMPAAAAPASHNKNCGVNGFLGLRPWYYGLCNENNEVKDPANENELKSFVWTIILNILVDLLLIVGYASMIFIIYGGYQFITSQGDPAKTASGKKTLTSAVIGAVIALSASVIVNTVMVALNIQKTGGSLEQGSADQIGADFTKEQVQNAFNWAYTMAGLVAVIFIVYGGIKYVTSQGDPAKARSAMQTILYAVVGLIVVLMAAAITALVTNSISSV